MKDTCRTCNIEFEPKAWQIKKHDHFCPTCRSEKNRGYFRKYRSENRDKIREISAKSREKNSEYYRSYHKEYKDREGVRNRKSEQMKSYRLTDDYKVRMRANGIVSSAIRSGTMKKEPCAICGNTESLEAHHEDYSKPRDVIWLCRMHHVDLHKKAKAKGV